MKRNGLFQHLLSPLDTVSRALHFLGGAGKLHVLATCFLSARCFSTRRSHPSILHTMASSFLHRAGGELRSLLTNRYLYLGLALLIALGLAFFFVLNSVVLPGYTRHDETITVPDVTHLAYEEAADVLRHSDLRVEQEMQRFDPEKPRDVVVDQSPAPETLVKPGRRVYLTVNTGVAPTVTVPRLEGFSPREAQNQLRGVGLLLGEVRADSIPHPYQNTVTRQDPPPGIATRAGEAVTIWVSTGPGDQWVTVPDVTGMVVRDAQQHLLDEFKLRSRVLGAPDDADPEEVLDMLVTSQSNVDARVRQGYEVRLHVDEPAEEGEDG